MTPKQSRMARAGLQWTYDYLAEVSGVGRSTAIRFERGDSVAIESVDAIKAAYEREGVTFVETGRFEGAVHIVE